MDQLVETAGGHAARRVCWRLGGRCGRLGHGLASPVVGAALCYCGARGGSVGRLPLLCVCSDVSRSAASCARGGGVCFWRLCCARGPSSQLLCGLRAEGWLGVAGDVFYRPSSAIGMCAGGMVAFWAHGGPKVTILFARCMMTSPRTGRALLARSGRAFAISRGVFEQLALPVSSSSHDCCQDEGCWNRV